MSYGFPKSCHLRKSWEYQLVWKMGCKLHTPHFILLLAKNSCGQSRLGLTVSRKIGNAVMRNRVKRHIREFFRHNKDVLKDNVDISIVAKRGASSLSMFETIVELRRALELKGHLNG